MRLFVAVDLSDELRSSVSKVSNALSAIRGVKAVEVENLHITLMFLGEVEERKVDAVKDALSKVEFEPFRISLRGVGFFPPRGAPRVVWVGVSEGEDELRALADSVAAKLKRFGFKRDKDFAAHVTVGRVKRRESAGDVRESVAEFKNADFGSMIVDSFRLKQSILKPTGPVYRDVEVYAAKGGKS